MYWAPSNNSKEWPKDRKESRRMGVMETPTTVCLRGRGHPGSTVSQRSSEAGNERVFRFNTCDIPTDLQRHLSEEMKLEQITLRIK